MGQRLLILALWCLWSLVSCCYEFAPLLHCHLPGGDGVPRDPLVWSPGDLPKRRRLVLAVCDRAMLLGPASIWTFEWVNLLPSAVTAEDVGAWPYSVGILVEWVAFWVPSLAC